MNNLHFIYTPMTGVGLHGGFRGNKWYKHRIEIFKKYTLNSLVNQFSKGFIHWISFRPEEANNTLTFELYEYMQSLKYPFIFTFDGLMYWDDKFTYYTFKNSLRNLFMMLWDCWTYKEWKSPKELLKYTWENKNKTLPERLKKTLGVFTDLGYDWVYMTRIDSDDMFHKDAVTIIQQQLPEKNKALVFDGGFIYNVKTGQLADWNPPTNPPFHTIIFDAKSFFDAQKHLEYYQDFRTHEDITSIFHCETLDDKKYMVSFHGKQISTGWDSPLPRRVYQGFKYGKGYCYTTSGRNISTHWQSRTRHVKNFMIGKEYEGEEKKEILKDFGI